MQTTTASHLGTLLSHVTPFDWGINLIALGSGILLVWLTVFFSLKMPTYYWTKFNDATVINPVGIVLSLLPFVAAIAVIAAGFALAW